MKTKTRRYRVEDEPFKGAAAERAAVEKLAERMFRASHHPPADPRRPRRPPSHWTRLPAPADSEAWSYGGLVVVSRLGKETSPEKADAIYWWLAIEKRGRPPDDTECARVLTAFGMPGAEEATGKTGNIRHWFEPILMT
jgi:hypothetical protein